MRRRWNSAKSQILRLWLSGTFFLCRWVYLSVPVCFHATQPITLYVGPWGYGVIWKIPLSLFWFTWKLCMTAGSVLQEETIAHHEDVWFTWPFLWVHFSQICLPCLCVHSAVCLACCCTVLLERPESLHCSSSTNACFHSVLLPCRDRRSNLSWVFIETQRAAGWGSHSSHDLAVFLKLIGDSKSSSWEGHIQLAWWGKRTGQLFLWWKLSGPGRWVDIHEERANGTEIQWWVLCYPLYKVYLRLLLHCPHNPRTRWHINWNMLYVHDLLELPILISPCLPILSQMSFPMEAPQNALSHPLHSTCFWFSPCGYVWCARYENKVSLWLSFSVLWILRVME